MPSASSTATTPHAAWRKALVWRGWRPAAVAALLAVGLLMPELLGNPYLVSAAVVILNYAVCATAWNFMGGLTGYISFGHGAFFGIAAYATGISIREWGIDSFVAVGFAVLLVMAVAVPVGYAALRVRGSSFVIVTISFVLIALLVAQGWRSLTGGSNGIVVPRPFPELLRPDHHLRFYYLYLGLLVLALLTWWVVARSTWGMGLKAVREDEDKARSLGVPTVRYKLGAFVVSAGFTAAAGGFYALWFGDLDPVFQFSILFGSYLTLMALVGGSRHLFGPLLGAVVVGVALEYFKLEYGDTQLHLTATGILLALVVLFMPEGVIPALLGLRDRLLGGSASSIREITAEEHLDTLNDARPTASTAAEGR